MQSFNVIQAKLTQAVFHQEQVAEANLSAGLPMAKIGNPVDDLLKSAPEFLVYADGGWWNVAAKTKSEARIRLLALKTLGGGACKVFQRSSMVASGDEKSALYEEAMLGETEGDDTKKFWLQFAARGALLVHDN